MVEEGSTYHAGLVQNHVALLQQTPPDFFPPHSRPSSNTEDF